MFTGYTDQTVDVFWGIRFNNDRAWFAEHKQEFQDAVMAPTKALAAELYDWFQADYPDLHLNLHISRIYRDARRLAQEAKDESRQPELAFGGGA